MQASSNEKESHSNDKELIKNNLIIDINKDNLGDLDALYFFDKVQMNTQGTTQHCIPILPINSDPDHTCINNKKKDNQTKMLYTNILGKLKNSLNSSCVGTSTLPLNKPKNNLK